MGFKIDQKVYELIPVGEYPAEIIQVDLETGQFGQQLKFTFSLLNKANQSLWGWASASFTTKSKLYAWTKAAFGGNPIPPNYNLDTDELIGRRVLLTVVIARKDDGAEYNKIQDVRPYLNPNGQQPVASSSSDTMKVNLYATGKPEAPGPAPIYMDGTNF